MQIRAVIKGKRYDTQKAVLVCSDEAPGCLPSDYRYWREELYCTPRGRWFVAGEGNELSVWAKAVGSSDPGPGSGIRPLSGKQALAWLEAAGDTAAIEHYFSGSVEDA